MCAGNTSYSSDRGGESKAPRDLVSRVNKVSLARGRVPDLPLLPGKPAGGEKPLVHRGRPAGGEKPLVHRGKPAGGEKPLVYRGRPAGGEKIFSGSWLPAIFLILAAGCATPKTVEMPETDALPEEELAKIATARFLDNRPYEFTWNNPDEAHAPLVDFEGLEGWTVVAPQGLKAKFERTYEKQLWGKYTAEFRCERAEDERRFLIRPPSPVPIPEDFDSVSLWIHRVPEEGAAAATSRVDLVLRDARGMERVVPLAALDWPQGWFLVQRRFGADALKGLRFPYEFAGLAVTCAGGREPLQIYFDSLSFFLAPRQPVAAPALETGIAADASVLPRPPATGIVHRTELVAPGVYRLACRKDGFEAEYRFEAALGLAGLSLWRNGKPCGLLMAEAAVQGLPADSRVRVLRQEGAEVYAEYESGLSLRLALTNFSLSLDARCPGGRAEGFSAGHPDGFDRVDLLPSPFLSFGLPVSPSVAMISGENRDVFFLSIWPDWYRSAASEMTSPAAEGDSLAGGARYLPTTAGVRNDFKERIVLTVSDRIEDVLPRVRHARAEDMKPLSDRLLLRVPGELDYRDVHQFLLGLCRYGMSNIIMATDRAVWTDGWGSGGLRTKANPHRGGDERLKKYSDTAREAGALMALYTHSTELSPLNRNWNPAAVSAGPDGAWLRLGASAYALKPSQAPETAGAVLRAAVSNYAPGAVVADGIADAPPWHHTDCDARAAGAGRFTAAHAALATVLRGAPVPAVAPDETSPLYAGMADAFITGARAWNREPGDSYFPLFKLMALQPLSLWFGPGMPFRANQPPDDRLLDEWMAAWLAHGQLGELPFGWNDPQRMARIFYSMRALQPFYAGMAPRRIAWWDGRRLLTASEALARGMLEHSQMYFQYPSGFELWVNGSPRKNWPVRIGGTEWTLPPAGWLASAPDFLSASVLVDGQRLDFVRTPDFVFYDGRGREQAFENHLSSASIVVRRADAPNKPGAIEVFDTSGGRRTGISADWFGGAEKVECRVQNEDGESWSEVSVRKEGDMYLFKGPSSGTRYALWPVR